MATKGIKSKAEHNADKRNAAKAAAKPTIAAPAEKPVTESNAAKALAAELTMEQRIDAHYGKADMAMHAAQKSSGVSQQGSAMLLHSVSKVAGKSIIEARSVLNSFTTCCHKRDGSLQAVCLQGGKQVYCESSHYGFLYGTNSDSKFKAWKPLGQILADLQTAYGAAVCEAHGVSQDAVSAHVKAIVAELK